MSLLDKIRRQPQQISNHCKAYGPKVGSSEGLPDGWLWYQVQYYHDHAGVWHLQLTAEGPHALLPYYLDPTCCRPNVLKNRKVTGEGHTWEEAMEAVRRQIE